LKSHHIAQDCAKRDANQVVRSDVDIGDYALPACADGDAYRFDDGSGYFGVNKTRWW